MLCLLFLWLSGSFERRWNRAGVGLVNTVSLALIALYHVQLYNSMSSTCPLKAFGFYNLLAQRLTSKIHSLAFATLFSFSDMQFHATLQETGLILSKMTLFYTSLEYNFIYHNFTYKSSPPITIRKLWLLKPEIIFFALSKIESIGERCCIVHRNERKRQPWHRKDSTENSEFKESCFYGCCHQNGLALTLLSLFLSTPDSNS